MTDENFLNINVSNIYKKYPVKAGFPKFDSFKNTLPFGRIYKQNFLPVGWRSNLWYLLHRARVDQDWFDKFKSYWRQILGGPVFWSPDDLIFTRNLYRLKFRYSKVKDYLDSEKHLKAWQEPGVLYQLLDMVFRESLVNHANIIFEALKNAPTPTVSLEFGCGTAPVTTSFFDFFNTKDFKFYIADMQTIYFHYAAYKFRSAKNVHPVELLPAKNFLPDLPQRASVIFCMAVYEHLDRPLTVTRRFYDLLVPGGLLVFDYVRSNGEGMDSVSVLTERSKTLDFLKRNFSIVHGSYKDIDAGGAIIIKKKQK